MTEAFCEIVIVVAVSFVTRTVFLREKIMNPATLFFKRISSREGP